MKKVTTFVLTLFIGFCVLVATDRKAYAYVDPGTGLLALQSVASMAAAAGYFMRRRIKALFTGKDPLEEKKSPEPGIRVPAGDDSARRA